MFEVIHQLIDRVRWATEAEQQLAHQLIEDYRILTGAEPVPPSTVATKPAALSSVADAGSSK